MLLKGLGMLRLVYTLIALMVFSSVFEASARNQQRRQSRDDCHEVQPVESSVTSSQVVCEDFKEREERLIERYQSEGFAPHGQLEISLERSLRFYRPGREGDFDGWLAANIMAMRNAYDACVAE